MVKIAICEDNRLQKNIIEEYLYKILEERKIDHDILAFESGEELLEKYPSDIDILILDIQMNGLTGMETAKKIRNFDSRVEIIFTTGLWDYIQKGYEVRAYRYLIKPIEYKNFKEQINLCISDIMKKNNDYLVINARNNIKRIKISSILYIETKIGKRELIVHTKENIEYIKVSMSKIESELEKHKFIRCHTGYIVNLSEIDSLNQNILLIKGDEVPVSKRKLKEVKQKLTSILGDVVC